MDTTKDPLLIAAAIAALILLLLFAGFLVIITRFQKKAFYIRNKAALAKLEVLEKERDRMARDLHDELSPLLTRIFMQVDVCSNRYGSAVATFLAPTKQNLSHLIDRVGEIIKNIDNQHIINQGLEPSVRVILEQYKSLQKLNYRFRYDVKEPLPRPVTTGLYLIILELLQNTLKHAEATGIELKIWQWRSFLFFYYKDNGANLSYPANPSGIGLQSLQQRIELMGGFRETHHQPEKAFQFHVPLNTLNHESRG